ncbi:HEPN domain-containing protein [Azospirillum sp. B510]|uniref:HEPN domain-containing protein n=1 Tax=Azospirillum sp. (strain B510) TaxID=137722 RepID=UPI0011D126EA|nr:HEPN domain-containing protein [Azospirillum sp. B510]
MSEAFARYTPLVERTFALRAFNECETEINQHFWSFKVISEYSRFIARAEQAKSPNTPTSVVFHATGPDACRIPPTVSDWLSASDELENWLRLSALVSASSYLEVYLRQVVRSALMSDPLCRFSLARTLDGTKLLKANREMPYEKELESVTKGSWESRSAAFKSLFGSAPHILTSKANLSKLEKIRNMRNDFAHGFGRSLDVASPTSSSIGPSSRLTQRKFIEYVAALSKTAMGIDRFLIDNFIGNFEFIVFYHEWKSKPILAEDRKYTAPRALQRAFNRDARCPTSTEFCAGLIKFYDEI